MVLKSRQTVALVLSLLLVALWLPSALVQHAKAATTAGFEIDGDVTPQTALDWTSPAVTGSAGFTVVHDNAGGDHTGFGASSKESNAPTTWGNTASPPGKADIADVLTYAHNDNNTAYLDFAWTRLSANGTDGYYLELNKKPNATHKVGGIDTRYPDRSTGDARFLIKEQGNGTLTLDNAWTWNATTDAWDAVAKPPASAFDSAVNTAAVTPPDSDTYGADQFLEVSLDLTAILGVGPSCPGAFGYVNFRSFTGNSNDNLEDYVDGFTAPAGDTCSMLKIEKRDAAAGHALLEGARFKIEPDPRTGVAGSYATVRDNDPDSATHEVADSNPADGLIQVIDAQPGTYTITETDAPDGYKIDTTSGVTAQAPASGSVTKTFYDTKIVKSLKLVKATSTQGYDAVGDKIDYTYTLTNTGNVDLTAPYDVKDLVESSTNLPVTCDNPPAVLPNDGGKTAVVCTATYKTSQADVDRGSVTNDAVGSATYGKGTVTSNHDSVTVNGTRSPALHLVKSVAEPTYDHAGQVLHYSYVLTNAGNVTLAAPYSISDDKIAAADLSCPSTPATLAPNSSDRVTCTGVYTVSQAELDAGTTITNKANGYAFDGRSKVTSNLDTASVTASRTVALHLDKAVQEKSYSAAGDSLHYTYTLTNTGKVTLSAPYAVSDDKVASVNCPSTPASLAPGGSLDCTATYTVTQPDVDAGTVVNKATATAKDRSDTVTSNQAQATVGAIQHATLSLVKTAVTTSYAHAGDVLHYSYALKNSGNVTLLAPYTVDDDVINAAGGTVNCPLAPSSLNPGDTVTCVADYTATQANVDAGSVHNTAVGHAFVGSTKIDSDPSDATVPAVQAPAVTLVKSVDKDSAGYGDTLTYTLTATNSGNETLTGVVVTDVVPDGTTFVDGSAGPDATQPSYASDTKTVSWQLGTMAPGAASPALTFQVTIDQPTFDSATGLPAEVIDNVADVAAQQVANTPSNHVKTPVTAVLGVKVVRKPPTTPPTTTPKLPFTGMPVQQAVTVALTLLAAGILLTSVRRRRGA